jgi:hypothetical protein
MKLLGANWQTTVSMIGGTIGAALTWLSTVSYDQGAIAAVIPVKYKGTVTLIAGFATLVLFVWNGIQQKTKSVTGGSVQQTLSGNLAAPGTQNLVDITAQASSHEERAAIQ